MRCVHFVELHGNGVMKMSVIVLEMVWMFSQGMVRLTKPWSPGVSDAHACAVLRSPRVSHALLGCAAVFQAGN